MLDHFIRNQLLRLSDWECGWDWLDDFLYFHTFYSSLIHNYKVDSWQPWNFTFFFLVFRIFANFFFFLFFVRQSQEIYILFIIRRKNCEHGIRSSRTWSTPLCDDFVNLLMIFSTDSIFFSTFTVTAICYHQVKSFNSLSEKFCPRSIQLVIRFFFHMNYCTFRSHESVCRIFSLFVSTSLEQLASIEDWSTLRHRDVYFFFVGTVSCERVENICVKWKKIFCLNIYNFVFHIRLISHYVVVFIHHTILLLSWGKK